MQNAKGYLQRKLVTNLFAYNVALQARKSALVERKIVGVQFLDGNGIALGDSLNRVVLA